jgi:PAS domain S-box-containing protein
MLNSKENTFRSIIENIYVGILQQDPNKEIIFSNKALLEMLGISRDQLLGKTSFNPDWNVIHEDGSLFADSTHPFSTAIASLMPITDVVIGINQPKSKDRVWLIVNAFPEINPEGKLDYVICTFNNISEQKKIHKKLQNIAWHQNHQIRGPLTSIMGIIAAMNFKITLEEKLTLLSKLEEAAKKLDCSIRTIIEEATFPNS